MSLSDLPLALYHPWRPLPEHLLWATPGPGSNQVP